MNKIQRAEELKVEKLRAEFDKKIKLNSAYNVEITQKY